MSDQPERLSIVVTSIDGSSASNNGESIKVGLTSAEGVHADAIMTTDRATDLMVFVGDALGEARRRSMSDPNVRYMWPVRSWEIAPQQNAQMLTFAFRLSSGNELCFQLTEAARTVCLKGFPLPLAYYKVPRFRKRQKN